MLCHFDTETQLIGPGLNAPPMSCMSVCLDERAPILLHWTEAGAFIKGRLQAGDTFVGANLPFDWLVCAANFPELLPLIFQAYREHRCLDVIGRQKLIDIASGVYRGYLNSKWRWVAFNYDLGSLARRHTDLRLNKDKEIQLTFGPLRDLPLDLWPSAHKEYALEDAVATRAVYHGQEAVLLKNPGVPILEDQHRQGQADFAFRLMSTWGLRTDGAAVDHLEKLTTDQYKRLESLLIEHGLVRADGTRDTKRAKARMLEILGWRPDPAFEGKKKEYSFLPLSTTPGDHAAPRRMHLTNAGDVSLASEACLESDDPVLEIYGEFGELKSVLSKDVKALRLGTEYPIHTHFGLAASGRATSAGPNVQNWRRLVGIREAFRPRVGWVYAQADVEGLELATLAQTCVTVLGYSKLADALNAGIDPHTDLACRMVYVDDGAGGKRCLTYEEGKARRKLYPGDPANNVAADPLYAEFDNARQSAKVANFGFPGGLGIKKMVLFAKATYGVVMTETECRALKDLWLSKWPEMQDYFAWINRMMVNPDGTGSIVQLFSNRIRGVVTYTAACNTFFQGLGADATKSAAWALCQACYDDRSSVMYGSRPVNYIHDEFIVETPDTSKAHDVAVELEAIMVKSIKPWTPDIRIAAPPLLMRYWSKAAKATRGPDGRLIPWE